ncbi:MAG TPA: hypothetical protein VN182_02520 [Flavobacterium sp.]|nr:hypothetical protein [Flavobacterium sp.]
MILAANKTLIEDIEAAKKADFTTDFMYAGKKIIYRKTKNEYTNKDCVIIEFCRDEVMNDPSDSSILFLLESNHNTKRSLSSAFGKDADPNLIDFVKKLNKIAQ